MDGCHIRDTILGFSRWSKVSYEQCRSPGRAICQHTTACAMTRLRVMRKKPRYMRKRHREKRPRGRACVMAEPVACQAKSPSSSKTKSGVRGLEMDIGLPGLLKDAPRRGDGKTLNLFGLEGLETGNRCCKLRLEPLFDIEENA